MVQLTKWKPLDKPSWKQFLLPTVCVAFMISLAIYLLSPTLPNELLQRKNLLLGSLAVTIGLLILGNVFSYLYKAGIQTYLCAVSLLMAVGFSYQFFFPDFQKYILLTFLGLAVGVGSYLIYRRINVLSDRMFWLCAAAIIGLLVINVLFGQEVYGAKLWIDLKVFTFQPGELVKVLLILLGASSFQKPLRSIAYCCLNLLSCAVLLLLHDLGSVAVIFALFVLMTYLLFDNRLLSISIIVAAALALVLALKYLPYAAIRFSSWTNAMNNPKSYQQHDFIVGILMGGIRGLGIEDYGIFTHIFAADNDGAIAGVMAVLGVPAAFITLGAYAILAAQSAFNRSVYTSSFFIHAQLGLYITIHVLLNFAGAADVLPFTGVVAPIISSGGSAILCLAILLGTGAAALNPQLNYYEAQ